MIGIYDYRNRVYSPDLGRFLQTDPIRFDAGDGNIYRYVGNDPVNWVDPTGEIKILYVIFICGRLFIDWFTDGDFDGNRKGRPEPDRTTQSQKAKADPTPTPKPTPSPKPTSSPWPE